VQRILFGVHQQGQTMGDYCDKRVAEMKQEVRLWPKDKMRGTDDQEVVAFLIDKYQASCPVLRRDDGHSIDPVNVQLEARSPIPGIEFGQRGPRRTVMGTKRTFVIPYDGDQELFFRRPNPFTSGSPLAVEIQPGEVRIHWEQPDNRAPNVAEMNTFVEQQLTSLQFYLDQVAGNCAQFNRNLASQAAGLVATEKQRLQAEEDVNQNLIFPLKRRPDADQFQIPLTRRPLAIRPEPTAEPKQQPQHALEDEGFEDVLKVLTHSRNAMERTPSLTEKLGEDQIRDILLINLNAVFEGAATGETFNHQGRTDILVRVQDTNIFVGECKIWSTEKIFTDALDDQLLRYLTWRDTKGALLLFIRNQDVTPVIEKAVRLIQEHPNHIKTLPTTNPDHRHDFVLHAHGDPQKKLHLAFLPFALGPVSKRKQK
jgi:hypothetical protein